MKPGLKLIAQPANENEPKGIDLRRGSYSIGILYADGLYVPTDGTELTIDELKQIIVISENFFLFYNNLK
jgi:hypothetical protein